MAEKYFYTSLNKTQQIELNKQKNSFNTHIFLLDEERIIECKISLPDNFVGDFINDVIVRHSIPQELIIKENTTTITLDESVKRYKIIEDIKGIVYVVMVSDKKRVM